MRIARGNWQQALWQDLEEGKTIESPFRALKGKAKSYMGRYATSFKQLLKRAEAQGYVVARIPGPREGEWLARYMLLNRPQGQEGEEKQ